MAGVDPDLAVIKSVDDPNPQEGDAVTFTVTVENQGDFPASDITINDLTPPGLTFVIASVVDGSYNEGTGDWEPPDLDVSDTATLVFIATVDEGTVCTCITNTATVTAVTPADPNSANDTASAEVCVGGADIVATKTVNKETPAEGEVVEFTVTIQNTGPADGTNILVVDSVPPGLTYLYHFTDPPSTYDPGTGQWEPPPLMVGSSATIRIGAKVDAGTAGTWITNTANAVATTPLDCDATNDLVTAVVCPTNAPATVADLGLFGTPPFDVTAGEDTSLSGFIPNDGPDTAVNVRVIYCVPGGWELLPDTPEDCMQEGDKIICELGTLNPFGAAFPDLFLKAPDTPGDYTITCIATSDTPDDDPVDNEDTFVVTVAPRNAGGETVDQSGSDGDPVNTRSGELFETQPADLNLGGPLPVFLQRYYASHMQREGFVTSALGNNWQHNYDIRLTQDSTNITVAFKRGRILFFEDDGAGWNLIRHATVPFRLVESGNDFILGDPRVNFLYTFDTNGLLTSVEDGRGNQHQLAYNGEQLATVGDGLGRQLTFSYNPDGLLTNVSDGTRSVQYTYVHSNLTAFVDAGGRTTTYSYASDTNFPGLLTAKIQPEGNAPFVQQYDPEGRVVSQADANANTTTFEYAIFGATIIEDPLAFTRVHSHDGRGRLTAISDEMGNALLQFYGQFTDPPGRPITIRDRNGNDIDLEYHQPSGKPAEIDPDGLPRTQFGYAGRNLSGIDFFDLSQVTHGDNTVDFFFYDPLGNLVRWTDRAGNDWAYAYDGNGRLVSATNPLGGVATFTYDGNARLASSTDDDVGVTTYAYDALNRLTNVVHPDGSSTTFEYDDLNRLTGRVDERGNPLQLAYDGNGRLTNLVDALGQSGRFTYDGLDRLVRITDRAGKDTTFSYDARGFVNTISNRNGNATRFDYDGRRRLTSITDAADKTSTFTYDDEGVLTSAANPLGETVLFENNNMGNVIGFTDPLGHTATLTRDAMERIIEIVDARGQMVSFGYEARGMLTNVARVAGVATHYEYDSTGRLTRMHDPNNNEWDFGPTPAGRLRSITDPLSRSNVVAYDSRGHIQTITYADGSVRSNTYDAAGNIVQTDHSDGTAFVYHYDALNRVTNANEIAFEYDAEGRVTETLNGTVSYGAAYDDDGRITNVTYHNGALTVTYVYDAIDRLVQVTDNLSGGGIHFMYDNADRVTDVIRSNGVHAIYTYDAAGRRTRIQEGGLIDIQYTYDAGGLPTEIDYTAVPLDPASVIADEGTNLTYDAAAQVATGGYQYDARGRLTNAPNTAFAWDDAQRLVAIDNVEFSYNPFGDLVTRTDGANSNRYFYNYALGSHPIMAEQDETTGEVQRYYVWSPGGTLLYFIEAATGNAVYYHFNRRGDTIALTDETGAQTDAYAYDPYGRLIGQTGTSDQPFTFGGRDGVRAEPAGGLYHMRARYYDPGTARFLSPDSEWPALVNPKHANPYQYALQNPLAFIDPEGTDEDSADDDSSDDHSKDDDGSDDDDDDFIMDHLRSLDPELDRLLGGGRTVAFLIGPPVPLPEPPPPPVVVERGLPRDITSIGSRLPRVPIVQITSRYQPLQTPTPSAPTKSESLKNAAVEAQASDTPKDALRESRAGNRGFLAVGRPLDLDDRIGGQLSVLGRPASPVVITPLEGNAVGSGFSVITPLEENGVGSGSWVITPLEGNAVGSGF